MKFGGLSILYSDSWRLDCLNSVVNIPVVLRKVTIIIFAPLA